MMYARMRTFDEVRSLLPSPYDFSPAAAVQFVRRVSDILQAEERPDFAPFERRFQKPRTVKTLLIGLVAARLLSFCIISDNFELFLVHEKMHSCCELLFILPFPSFINNRDMKL